MPAQRKILVADDDRMFVLTLSLEFRNLGWDVYCCVNGTDALKQVRSSAYDVVLTDFDMPTMNGVELATAIRREFPQVRVLLMSSLPKDRMPAIPQGVPFLAKPVKAKTIVDAFEASLARAVRPVPPA